VLHCPQGTAPSPCNKCLHDEVQKPTMTETASALTTINPLIALRSQTSPSEPEPPGDTAITDYLADTLQRLNHAQLGHTGTTRRQAEAGAQTGRRHEGPNREQSMRRGSRGTCTWNRRKQRDSPSSTQTCSPWCQLRFG
jgi:hypothetical protein